MASSLYERDTQTTLHRGAVYKYRPIFWLEPPLWILRGIQWTPPRHASLHEWRELRDAFRLGSEHEEDVVARAKVRFVVVLSRDFEARDPRFDKVIVAPTYSLDPARHKPGFLERVRRNEHPELHYLASDPGYPGVGECYIDFRQVQSLHKHFLNEGKLEIAFTPEAIKAILYRYKQYL